MSAVIDYIAENNELVTVDRCGVVIVLVVRAHVFIIVFYEISFCFFSCDVGFGLLTVALVFGFFTIDDFFAQHLAHKTAFSIISWFVYGSLLIGHYKFGWRGQKAIRFTLLGFFLLALGFIGSKVVLEMILKR